MIELDFLDEQINRYYDKEMNESEIIAFEAKMQSSFGIKSYVDEKCYGNYKISNSINIAKYRAQRTASEITSNFFNEKNKKKLFL